MSHYAIHLTLGKYRLSRENHHSFPPKVDKVRQGSIIVRNVYFYDSSSMGTAWLSFVNKNERHHESNLTPESLQTTKKKEKKRKREKERERKEK